MKFLTTIILTLTVSINGYSFEEKNCIQPFKNLQTVDKELFISTAQIWDKYLQQLLAHYIKDKEVEFLPVDTVKVMSTQIKDFIIKYKDELDKPTEAQLWRIYAGLAGDVFKRSNNPFWATDAYKGLRNATLVDKENPQHVINFVESLKGFEKFYYAQGGLSRAGIKVLWGRDFDDENRLAKQLIGLHKNDNRIKKLQRKYYDISS